jgi:AcrR family transcriptional regulator
MTPSSLEPRRGLTAKGRATRERIIREATALFASQSYAAVSIREIADRSGVSSGAIYATFRGKADVLAEVVSASLAADLEMIEPDVEDRPLPEVVARQFVRHDAPGRRRLRLLLMNAAAAARTDPDVRGRLGPLLQERMSGWTAAYVDWQESVGVRPELDMATLVALLVSMDLGLAVLEELGAAGVDGADAGALVDVMLAGLLAR